MRALFYGALEEGKGVVYSSLDRKKVEDFITKSGKNLKIVYKYFSI